MNSQLRKKGTNCANKYRTPITKLGDGESVVVTCWDYDRKKLVTEVVVTPGQDNWTSCEARALVHFSNQVNFVHIVYKDGIRFVSTGRCIRENQILGIVKPGGLIATEMLLGPGGLLGP